MFAEKLKGKHAEKRLLREFALSVSPDVLKKTIDDADAFAHRNIWHRNSEGMLSPKGGPFAAQNFVMTRAFGGQLTAAGDIVANNVVATGIVSNHAEAMAMQPAQIRKLRQTLACFRGNSAIVVQVSSAESCPSCMAKQMILQRYLHKSGLIGDDSMVVAFNAPYKDTLEKAGFNDLPYAVEGVARRMNPKAAGLMVKVKTMDWKKVPLPVREEFLRYANAQPGNGPVRGFSVAYRPAGTETPTGIGYAAATLPGLLATGTDKRALWLNDAYPRQDYAQEWGDIFATAEVEAIRAKCTSDRKNGIFAAWKTAAQLFTLTPSPGALGLAEAKWGSVTDIIAIRNAPEAVRRIMPTREMPEESNRRFLERSTRGYNKPGTGLSVIRVRGANKAQPDWPKVLKQLGDPAIHYDGLGGFSEFPRLAKFKKRYYRRFTAPLARCAR